MAELKVYSTIGVRSAAEDLFAQFEAASGHKLVVTWGTAPMLVKRIEGGETADVLILSRAGLDALSQQGKVMRGSEVPLASSGVGIAVKAGAPKPDISTPDALKRTLLEAKSIAYTEPSAGGASGVYFAKLLERMGIADAMKAKTRFASAGGNAASLLVSGDAELAVQQKPELMAVSGVEVVGPLPGDFDHVTAFVAGVSSTSKNADAARALLKFLQTPEAAKIFTASGFNPS